MQFTDFYIKGYRPLGYGGISELTIDSFRQINILTGENGKGKSSLLRELTPYPSIRSDYEKNGCKRLELMHDKHAFVISSDFSKPNVHSFIIDGVEQNVSGTADVQCDLVEQYFVGYSRLIEKLMSGGCKFSSMSRNERKQLMMTTYPSNLDFVLAKHKNLMSKIRAANSQLKLLKERELKLKESLISDDVLEYHKKMRDLMNQAILAIDQDAYAFEMAIKPYVDSPEYKLDLPYTMESIQTSARNIHDIMCRLIRDGYRPLHPDELDGVLHYNKIELDRIEETINKKRQECSDMVDELEKYKEALGTDSAEVLKSLKLDKEVQEGIIRKYPCQEELTVLDDDAVAWWKSHVNNLHALADLIDGSEIIWSKEVFNDYKNDINQYQYELSECNSDIKQLEGTIAALDARLKKYAVYEYPEDCKRPCSIREAVERMVEGILVDRKKASDDMNDLLIKKKCIEDSIDTLKKAVMLRSTSIEIVDQFDRYFSQYTWGSFVLNGKSFVDAANTSIINIVNRMSRLIAYTEEQKVVKEAQDRLNIINIKIDALELEHLPSKGVIKKMVSSFEKQIADYEQLINSEKARGTELLVQYEKQQEHSALVRMLDDLYNNFSKLVKKISTTAVVDFVRKEIAALSEKKIKISEALRASEQIVAEQDNLRTRLHDEILPMMQSITDDVTKWNYVEKELSPVTGIPKRVMVKYINEVFRRANRFISQVWNYEMELVYLKEDEDCDYSFPVLINNDGIVKDISICSKGQKEIIDLAIILAICTYRGYTTLFPLKLDEMSSGLSPDHNSKLFGFLGDLLERDNIIDQIFIVSHDPIVNNGFENAGYVALSNDNMSDACLVISKTK